MSRPVITKALAEKLALSAPGSYSNEGNALQHTLYDTIRLPAALGSDINYFTQPIGSTYGNGTKTLVETNLSDAGKLPNGQTFLMTSMSLALKTNADSTAGAGNALAEDVINGFHDFLQNSTFEIVIAGREYDFQVPGTEFVPTVPVAQVATANLRQSGDYWTSGWVKINVTPVAIGNLVSFKVLQRQSNQITAALTQINRAMAAANAQDVEVQMRVRGVLTRSI
jgi:hypothetical protein